MECYYLKEKEDAANDFAYATIVDHDRERSVCRSCGRERAVFFSVVELKDVHLRMPDVMMEGEIVSERGLEALLKAGVRGLHPRGDIVWAAYKEAQEELSDEEYAACQEHYSLGSFNTNLVLLQGGMKPIKRLDENCCVDCGGKILAYPPRVAVDWSTWNGADYFFIKNLLLQPMLTPRFVDVVVDLGLDELYEFVPLDETTDRDFFNWDIVTEEELALRHRPGDPWPPARVSSR